MDRDYFLNAGITPSLHFESSPSPLSMPVWRTRSDHPSNQFQQPNWEKSTDHYTQFDSALSSMVSSPVASNDGFVIRELIGKLGNTSNNTVEISPPFLAALGSGGTNVPNTSCYSTPLNSPPKMSVPIMDHLFKENASNSGNSMSLNPGMLTLSTDPGYAERAAKLSCFGNRSFNCRGSQLGLTNSEFQLRSSVPVSTNSRLHGVSSSPSLNNYVLSSAMAVQENMNSQTHMEIENSNEESSVSEQIPAQNEPNSRKRKAVPRGKSKENASAKKGVEAVNNANAKKLKNEEDNGGVKTEVEMKGADNGEEEDSKKKPEPPKDYIHVRARRGQATDSHSLAERVRREKIGERMKLLQDLVPGCNKITGKALMLDEIINYVQSLQGQVEFLSMKLATVNPRLDSNTNSVLSKDVHHSNGNVPYHMNPMESPASIVLGQQQSVQNPQIHNNILDGPIHPMALVHGFGEALPQFAALCEDDLQSIVQMELCDNLKRNTQFNSQSFCGN